MNALLEVLAPVGLGLYFIRFARRAYWRPDDYIHHGYIIPSIRWTPKRLRGHSIFLLFAGVLMISGAIAQVLRTTPLSLYGLVVWLTICAAVTLLLIPRRSTFPGKSKFRKLT